jgi:hypothetical protein
MSLVQGGPATITMEGQVITITNGYPDEDDIELTLTDYSGFTISGTAPKVMWPTGVAASANCRVTYAEAAGGNPPTIIVDSSACG